MYPISDEVPAEAGAREALLDRAMGPARHIKTSARLRAGRRPAEGLALVARAAGPERDPALDPDVGPGLDVSGTGRVVGTVRLWHVALGGAGGVGDGRACLMLGPLAVEPSLQGAGVGGRLMRRALAEAVRRGHAAVILVGDPDYYVRFGFSADLTTGLALPGPVERHRFLGLELIPGALAGATGLVRATGAPVVAPAEAADELALAS
jgi:predicted N-acetyltransferase YhbS